MYCIPAAEAAVADPGSLCVVVGGSGNGEQIAANKVIGVRAALAYDHGHRQARTPAQRRQRDLASAAGCTPRKRRWSWSEVFLATPFSGEERHARRIRLLAEYEDSRG